MKGKHMYIPTREEKRENKIAFIIATAQIILLLSIIYNIIK